MNAPTTRAAGRGWAYLGAALGGAVSIAANVAHSYVRPEDAPADWSPEAGAVVGSIFWPVALFVAVEILARTAWPTGRGWTLLRFGGLLPVALVAALVSYRHLSGLLGHYGEDAVTATVGPIAVDGLMLMATGALLATGRRATASATATATGEAVTPATARPPVTATMDTATLAGPGRAAEDTATATPEDAPTDGHRPRPTSPRPRRRTATGDASATATTDDMAARVAAILAARPDVTAEDVAAEIGRAPRTARRYLAAVRADLAGVTA
ncbi:DUF2637 domain-containing protein [Micromonospora sp. NPDC047707]|uniref:DUF2637 domain-containing protein n=1 Tax=Micromonospora sp. NPDC047707 TaxID=3154498 RepID=UPI0034570EAB